MFRREIAAVIILIHLYYNIIFAERKYIAKLERLEITAPDPEYITNVNYSYKKFNRTSPYFVNIEYDIVKAWYGNISMNVKSYEWKNNQYKESVISYENELCHLLENDIFVFKIVRHYSTLPKKCPVPAGHFEIKDLIMDAKYLPPFIPISKWSMVLRFFINKSKKDILIAKVFLNIEDNLVAKKKG